MIYKFFIWDRILFLKFIVNFWVFIWFNMSIIELVGMNLWFKIEFLYISYDFYI